MCFKKTWIGLAHVKPRIGNNLLDGAEGVFVPAVALADDENDFASSIATHLNAYEFNVLVVEDIELLERRLQHFKVDNEIVEMALNLTLEEPVALCQFEAYESE